MARWKGQAKPVTTNDRVLAYLIAAEDALIVRGRNDPIMRRALGLDRIAALERGEDVPFRGWEVR